MKINIFQPAQ